MTFARGQQRHAEIGSVDRTIVGNIHRPSERLLLLAIESENPSDCIVC